MSSGSAPLPPQKKIATAFSPPNHDQIKEALQSGGTCKFNLKTVFQQKIIQVDFYAILTCNINDLVAKKAAFDFRDADLSSGNIQLDISANALIGVGAFKTAQRVQLMLLPPRDSGIGLSLNHCIVLK
ncbi:hypothetical protein EDC04DRAFT_2899265 [Pisolithus marmoratus]|nr:hypothetical protein EDC04DRAFT_2899265 [Pisolithus marmoratus]